VGSCTRFQADRDLIVIPELRGQPIDPSSGGPERGFLSPQDGLGCHPPQKRGFEKCMFLKKRNFGYLLC